MMNRTCRHILATLVAIAAFAPGVSAEDPCSGAFAWGVDAGGSIDMSANNMSTIDFSANVGYKRGWISFIGAGVGADIMVSNSCRSFPIYAAFSTNFSKRPSLLFLDVRVGMSLNYLLDDYSQIGAYSYCGVGFNLARSEKYASYLKIGYTFKSRRDYHLVDERVIANDLHMATVGLGIRF